MPNPNAEEFVPQKAKFHFENQVVREAEDISQTDSLSSDEVDLTPKKDSQTRRERSEGQRIPKVILTHQISYNYLHRENVKSYYQKWIEDPAQSPRNLLEYPGSSLQNVEDLGYLRISKPSSMNLRPINHNWQLCLGHLKKVSIAKKGTQLLIQWWTLSKTI